MLRALLACALVAAASIVAHAQRLSAEDIDAAIKAGLAGKRLNSSCHATGGFLDLTETNGGFDVIVEGPVGRIMRLAAEAKKKYQPFTAADVTDTTLEPTIYVVANPAGPRFVSGSWHRTPPAEHVVLKRKDAKGDDPKDVLQPESHELVPTSWSNALGGKWDGQGIVGSFSYDGFKAMPGDQVDIVVITPAGERRCKIGRKDRAALR